MQPTSASHPARSDRRFLLAATILASSMAFIDGIVVNVALPAIQTEFHVGFDALQWVINGYALILGALILTGGVLGDRYGRRFIFVLGIAVFALASIACALAPSAGALITSRVVQGVGGALLVPQSLAIIAAAYSKEARGHAVGIWAAAAALTTVAGPIVGGIFIDLLSWRAVFWINVPLAVMAIGLTLRFVPESRGTVRGATDWTGGALVTAGLALLIYSTSELPEARADRGVLLIALAAGVLMLCWFIFHESRSEAPLMPLSIFRSRVFSTTNAITVGLYFALSVVFFLLPYTLIQVHGYTGLQAGTALIPFGVVMGVFSPLAGKLGARLGLRATLSIGSSLVAVACAGFVIVERQDVVSYWSGYFPAILVLAIGMTLSVSPLTTAVLSSVPDEDAGVASGVNNALSRVAGVLAVAAAGLISLVSFPYYLTDRLAAADIGQSVRAALLSEASRLAALPVPPHVTDQMAILLKSVILDAYVDSYCAGMLVAAVVALLTVAIALRYLPERVTTSLVRK